MALTSYPPLVSVIEQRRVDRLRRRLAYLALAFVTMTIGAIAYVSAPEAISLGFLVLVASCVVALVRPDLGVFAIVGLTMVADSVTASWYPFTKNLSSRESIMFVSDGLPMNPLEVLLVVTTASWLFRSLDGTRWSLRRSPLSGPLVVLALCAVAGMAFGLSRGGNLTVALWEGRPLFYLPLLYVLITNLLTTARQYEALFYTAIAGIAVQSVLALDYFYKLPAERREDLESLVEHSAAIHMNVVLLGLLAALTLGGVARSRKLVFAAAAIPIGWAWVVSQRRAAAIAFGVGLLLLGVVLLIKNRRAAAWFLPVLILGGTAYTLAFWNSTGTAGFAAQAIKSVIAPESLSAEDVSSDNYRKIEAFDLWFSIRSNELMGIGFGKPFLRPIPLPDISSYIFWAYIPHNSILWIWMKMGVVGFVAMWFVVVRAIQHGARAITRVVQPEHLLVLTAALSYVVMYVVYAYVDIAWDIRSMVFLAVAMAICTDLARLSERPTQMTPTSTRRELIQTW